MKLTTQLQRKDPRLPVYVVIPSRYVRPWGLVKTTMIEGTANGFPFGRRTIKAWGKGIDDWFVEFTAPFCKVAGLSIGDKVILVLQLADTSAPEELEKILKKNKRLAAVWMELTDTERRDLGEHIRAAKGQATRENRAKSVVEKLLGKTNT